MKPFTIDLCPVRSEKISAQEYLKLQKERPDLIARARFVPPKLGEDTDFGQVFVQYTQARHRLPLHG